MTDQAAPRPKPFWKSVSRFKFVFVALAVSLCMAVTLLTFVSVQQEQNHEKIRKFNKMSQRLAVSLQDRIQVYLDVLTASEHYITATKDVTFGGFSAFTREFLEAYPGIYALAWNPKVTSDERDAFQMKIRSQGFEDYFIKDIATDRETGSRTIIEAEVRDVYFPVAYIFPFARNVAAHGHDTYAPNPATDDLRRKILNRARDEGQAMATSRISLVQAGNQFGLLIYHPVFDAPASTASARERIRGYVGAAFLVPEIVRPIAQSAAGLGAQIILRDLGAPSEKQLLYDSRTTDNQEAQDRAAPEDNSWQRAIDFEIAGRRLELTVVQAAGGAHAVPWVILLLGGLMSVALGGSLQLMLSHTEKSQGATPAREATKEVAIYAVVLAMGVAASVGMYVIFNDLENRRLNAVKQADAERQFNAIKVNTEASLDVLNSVKLYFNSSNHVSRSEFHSFVTPLLSKNEAVQALEWVPRVAFKDRRAFEAMVRAEGYKEFSITEKTGDVSRVAKKRREYYPVTYLEPLQQNLAALGYDVASDERRREALNRSRDTGDLIATAPINLVQDTSQKTGFLIFNPVYGRAQTQNRARERKENILGFVLAVLRIEDLIIHTPGHNSGKSDVVVADVTMPGPPETIYVSKTERSGNSPEIPFRRLIDLGGRQWLVTVTPRHAAYLSDKSLLPLITLIGGLIITMLIIVGFMLLIRRREMVERLVDLRTNELRDAASRLQGVMDTVVDGVITINDKGIIQSLNPSAEKVFGYRAEEIEGQSVNMLMPPVYKEVHDGFIQLYLSTGEKNILGIGREVEAMRKDGSLFPMELGVNEMLIGNESMFVGSVRDISDRKKIEFEKEQLIEKLTDSNEELERFAYVCSHDLQEPLRMIRSFSERLQAHLGSELEMDEKGQKYFRFITDGAERAQQLIADILTYSSIDTNTLAHETVDLESLIEAITTNVHASLAERNGRITHEPLPAVPGNKTQLMQLLQNLIINGLKYQKPDTHPHVHVESEDMDDHWVFTVRDNGIGMEDRHLVKIFDVFQRLNNKNKYTGTGIGLSICKKVVERHGGKIWVESQKHVGSAFSFSIRKPTIGEAEDEPERKAG